MHLSDMKGYTPGTQPGAASIKLNTNENPFPPSPKVMAALANVSARALQRYPDPIASGFREAAANLHHVPLDQIIATNGGDELLRLALTTYVDPGRAIGVVTPGYGVYSVLSHIHQAPLSPVPLQEDWTLPSSATDQWNDDGAQLVILTNPHAPSGTLFPFDVVERVAANFSGVLLIDEAYVDFVEPALRYDTTALASRYPNILLLRTLSKGYSLAGIRLAYGLGCSKLIAPMLEKTKDSYNIDAIAQQLGRVALEDRAYACLCWQQVLQERRRLTSGLEELGFKVERSQANFVLASPPRHSPSNARELKDKLQDRDIYTRWFDEQELHDRLRISIGTSDENIALLTALRDLTCAASEAESDWQSGEHYT
ncbi:histidinol-phosphate transaminase [Rhizobium hainanense]|nr:histidinol-phosphate transaminase [Rhizobium hainanense]